MPKVIICAGEEVYPRWNNFMGIPRHCISVEGEPLIHRTQRQLLNRGFTDVVVMCDAMRASAYILNSQVQQSNTPARNNDVRNNCTVWAYQQHLNPDGPTVLMFADTYFTDAVMDNIAANVDRDFLVFGRWRRTQPYHSANQESFAIVLSPVGKLKYLENLEVVVPKVAAQAKGSPISGAALTLNMYDTMRRKAPAEVASWWMECNDETEDFDGASDWRRLHAHFPERFPKP